MHSGWTKSQGHTNAHRTEWWLANVVGGLVRMGLGQLQQGHDGQRYLKPTAEDLDNPHIGQLLQTNLQLLPEDVKKTLGLPMASSAEPLSRRRGTAAKAGGSASWPAGMLRVSFLAAKIP
jgi:hypothetical protein